jgi:hypothetical protein
MALMTGCAKQGMALKIGWQKAAGTKERNCIAGKIKTRIYSSFTVTEKRKKKNVQFSILLETLSDV